MKVIEYLDKNELMEILESIENNIISPELVKEVFDSEFNREDAYNITNIIMYNPPVEFKKQYYKNMNLIIRNAVDNYNKHGNKGIFLASKLSRSYFLNEEQIKQLLDIEKYSEDTIDMKINLISNKRVWKNKELLSAYFNLLDNSRDGDYARPHWHDAIRENFMTVLLNRVEKDENIINYINKYQSIDREKKKIIKNLLERKEMTRNSESFNKLYKIIDNLNVDELDRMYWLNGIIVNKDIDVAFCNIILKIKDDELMSKGVELIKKTEFVPGILDKEETEYVLGKKHDTEYGSIDFSDFNMACILLENPEICFDTEEAELLLSQMNVFARGSVFYLTSTVGSKHLTSDIVTSFISAGENTNLLAEKVRNLQIDVQAKEEEEEENDHISDDILIKVGKAKTKRDFNKILSKMRKD